MLSLFKDWLASLRQGPPALDRMRLGPDDHPNNPLMVRICSRLVVSPNMLTCALGIDSVFHLERIEGRYYLVEALPK